MGRQPRAGTLTMHSSPHKLLVRAFKVMAPVWVFLVLGELFLWLAGETTPIDKVISRHKGLEAPAAYLPGLIGQQFGRFHRARIEQRRPDVLVVGSSRVMRVREEMFLPQTSFYNSGRLVSSVEHLERLIAFLPADYTPKTVLIGVDSWWLAFDPPTNAAPVLQPKRDDVTLVGAHIHALRRLVQSIGQGKINLQLIGRMLRGEDDGIKRYGILAWTSGGFHNDGSYRDLTSRPSGRRSEGEPPTRLPKKIFADRTTVNPELFRRLMEALSCLEERGTCIVGFAPPYSKATRDLFALDPVQISYFLDFRSRIAEAFDARSWPYFDGSDPCDLELDDRCMEDSHHPMETYMVAVLLKLSEDPGVCRALCVNPNYLQSLLDHPATTAWYPAYPAYPAEGDAFQLGEGPWEAAPPGI